MATEAQPGYAGVLLAAGQASRFGGEKLLHPLADGIAIAAHAARSLRAAGVNVIAVVRSGDFALANVLEEEGCCVTMCRDAALGMGHSLAHGVREAHDAAGWVVALGDMPSIAAGTIVRVIDALRAGAVIAAPAYRGTRGHPVGFSRSCYRALIGLTGDSGAREIIDAYRGEMKLIECADPGVLYDIDRKDDLARPSI